MCPGQAGSAVSWERRLESWLLWPAPRKSPQLKGREEEEASGQGMAWGLLSAPPTPFARIKVSNLCGQPGVTCSSLSKHVGKVLSATGHPGLVLCDVAQDHVRSRPDGRRGLGALSHSPASPAEGRQGAKPVRSFPCSLPALLLSRSHSKYSHFIHRWRN